MLQEVSQATLRLILIDGTHTLCNVEVGHMFRILIVADVISQSIVQFTYAHGWVNGNRRHLLSF